MLGSDDEGEAFAELLAHWDAGSLSDAQKTDIQRRGSALWKQVGQGEHLTRWRFWNWLAHVASGTQDRHTVSIL